MKKIKKQKEEGRLAKEPERGQLVSRDENQKTVGLMDAKEERLKEGQWSASLKADVKSSETKIDNIPLDLST